MESDLLQFRIPLMIAFVTVKKWFEWFANIGGNYQAKSSTTTTS